jgi:hypothetical protein
MNDRSAGRWFDRPRAWLVTGPVGRGVAFAVDFAVALRTFLGERRGRSRH